MVSDEFLDLKPNRPILHASRLGDVYMSEFLPEEVRRGLETARKTAARRKSRLRVMVGEREFTILRYWERGFALDAEDAPHLRGLVDIYDGARQMSQCLIVASEEASGEMVYEFKRATRAVDAAPRDYARDEDAPVALIGRD